MVLTISVFYLLLSLVKLQEISHEVEDEGVIEGDIIGFTKFSKMNNKTLLNNGDEYSENTAMTTSMPWPNGIIPYEISAGFSNYDKKLILDMMAKIQNVSCIQFKAHHTESTYMEIRHRPYKQCNSFVGYEKKPGPRKMHLQSLCMNKHDIMHELMHTLGFFHEHNRIDRDEFVIIHYENIQPNFIESFKKRDFKEHVLIGTDYDFSSITHYPINAFAIDPRSPTIESRHGEEIKLDGLSEQDILKINRYYRCSEHRDSLSNHCPHSWFFDKQGFCYKALNKNSMSWDEANQACVKLNPEASLPIFHSESEYLSYNVLWSQRFFQSCSETSWLGITYNASTRNFSWVDGSKLTFSMLKYGEQPREGLGVHHYETGSNWQVTNKDRRIAKKIICQLHSNTGNNRILRDSIQYPKSMLISSSIAFLQDLHELCRESMSLYVVCQHLLCPGSKCPNKQNWVFDEDASICYYFNWQKLNWPSANSYCKSEHNSTLPYFSTVKEYESFRKLLTKLHIACNQHIWIGYIIYGDRLITVRGSIPSFNMYEKGYWMPSQLPSYTYFSWQHNHSWHQTDDTNANVLKTFLCQHRTETCPRFWTFDPTYPNICYHANHSSAGVNWYNAANYCHRLNSQATLPIFHDLSEYISYSKWAYEHHKEYCSEFIWLGISYNTASKNYSWIDGFNVSFNFYDHGMVVEDRSFYHFFSGSKIWWQVEKSHISSLNVCQLRVLSKNNLLKTTANVPLDYPKSRKCPQKENWYYDNYSDICYYHNQHDSRNWTSAFAHCKSEVGGSLPYFMTESEFDSFVNLIRMLHVPCLNNIWLGYYGQNYSFVNVNGSANSFLRWADGYPQIRSHASYVYFYWGYEAFKNEDSKMAAKNVLCQCRSGINCKSGSKMGHAHTSNFLGNCKTEKIETLHESLPRSPLKPLCPHFWTFDPTYPNICYHIKTTFVRMDWHDAANFCRQLNPQATLPVFHDLSEYISYSKWAYEHNPLSNCYSISWLGINYNTTSKNYSWVDGSNMSFNFCAHDLMLEENYTFYHSVFGSNKWKQKEKTEEILPNVCQLRINKSNLLKTTTNVWLGYPKSRKCPQKENWYYDNYSDICYYHNQHDSRNWTSALAYCKSTVGGSLPYFATESEFESFVKLRRMLHVYCGSDIWLGYYGQNYAFVNVNGSANSFFRWSDGYPRIFSDITYVYYSSWLINGFKNEDSKMMTKNVFCQCRSGINCKSGSKMGHAHPSNFLGNCKT